MSRQEITDAVTDALLEVAPEVDRGVLHDDVRLQEDLDLDSMDFLTFLTSLADRTGVDVPEEAYAEVATFGGCVGYVAARTDDQRPRFSA